ncbi:MAG: CDP-diacylglycerol--glycerol-3-phosphate 3-phosphatidyltransferase [Endomicrobia bacterium]|nr:CDP-diacylglycerol--glycerol-3-phosphate 3-phosphatidyltransferase [Endomicrobiia bacterium]MCL2507133.1 CDP-diacylglycerol--glycerol-3-phosphate 3-phosphatidyltransferase [Endomicrobiia bacterium]
MNLANKLTVARIFMVPFLILFIEISGFWASILALLVFVTASITDLLDGEIARRNNMITPLGIFLDPLADKLLISAAFICFVDISYLHIPAWMVIAIISREFLITGLRTIAVSKNVIIPADKAGKFKTTSQIVVIILILIILIIHETFFKFYGVTPEMLMTFDKGSYRMLALIMQKTPFWAVLVATILTIYSGFSYMWKHRELFK